jgi:hypothetical protein
MGPLRRGNASRRSYQGQFGGIHSQQRFTLLAYQSLVSYFSEALQTPILSYGGFLGFFLLALLRF